MDVKIKITAFRNELVNAVTVHLRPISFDLACHAEKISAILGNVNRLKGGTS
jgi:hypothetical protein